MTFFRSARLVRHIILVTAISALVAACATVPKPVQPVSTAPKGTVETVQSEVSLSLKAGGKSIGGHGYLVFKQPDSFHLAVLSPFGTTMMEVYVSDDLITCTVPSRQIAYKGAISGLPDHNALRAWGMMRWVVDTPAANGAGAGTREYSTADGRKEFLTYDERGLLVSKVNSVGDKVTYRDYRDRNGVAFPASIEMANAGGDTVKIVFEEPEINGQVEQAALTPNLDGMEVHPLTDFRGI
jgi:YD repeat-containing protein